MYNTMGSCLDTKLLLLSVFLLSSQYMLLTEADDRVVKKTIKIGGERDERGFTDEEKFQDIFTLTEDDFEERVLESYDPWIILFHTGMVDKNWKALAVAMRGIVWFGSIHKLEQEDLIDDMRYPLKKAFPARVYPWGSQRLKSKKWKDVETPQEAKTLVLESIPDPSHKFVPDELNAFLYEAYSYVPSRLPVVFFVKGEKLTPLFKSIALHYNKYFHFGFIPNPTKADLAVFQYTMGLPGMIVLVTEDFAKEPERATPDYDFDMISYSPESQGSMNYTNIIKFLYGLNYKYRETLPGANLADEVEVMEMEEELDIEKQRFNVRYVDKIKEVATYQAKQSRGRKTTGKKTTLGNKEEGKKQDTGQKQDEENKEKLEKERVVEKEEVAEETYEERKTFGKKTGKESASQKSKDEL